MTAQAERITHITVCSRPFRAAGPRIEAERFGSKLLIHNYGHGGAGWSLSWGSAAEVVQLASAFVMRDVAVVGCGALGLTAALALQRAGARVSVYARDLPSETRSSRASGSWTPDARVALAAAIDHRFAARWERWARTSFAEFQGLLRAPGEPVKVQPRYILSELAPEIALERKLGEDPIGFAHLEQRTADLWPPVVDLAPEQSPFEGLYAREAHIFRFDLARYTELLLSEFQLRGGVLRQRSFESLEQMGSLLQPVIVNCTGYGARALVGDDSVVPIRGQISWLPAQPEVQYSLQWQNLNVVSRPDGIVVQLGAGNDGAAGWQDAGEQPDLSEAGDAVRKLVELQGRRCTRSSDDNPFPLT